MPLLLLLAHELTLLNLVGLGRGDGLHVGRDQAGAARALVGYRLVRQDGNHLLLTLRGQTVLESATLRKGIVLERV